MTRHRDLGITFAGVDEVVQREKIFLCHILIMVFAVVETGLRRERGIEVTSVKGYKCWRLQVLEVTSVGGYEC